MRNNDIKLLKAGQTGFGVLIESDAGYISPSDIRNKPFITEIQKLGEGKNIMVEPLVLYVILQKWGVENRNGRIYPRHILERENDNYQQLIREHRAIGECVPRDTQIFTEDGWKNIQDMKIGDIIFTLNTETDKLEKQPVQKTTDRKYEDDMIHIYNSSSLDMLVTKKHKVVLWDKNHKPYILTAEELLEKINVGDSKVSNSYIKNSGDWVGEDVDYIKIPNSDVVIDSKLWAKFLGIFLADGHCSGTKSGEKNCVTIPQVKEETDKIIDLLDELPFEYSISSDNQYNIHDKYLYDFLFDLGNSEERFIPEYAKNWNVELLDLLLEWMLMSSINRKDSNGNLIREYYSVSDKLSEDVFEIMLKISNGATLVNKVENYKSLNIISEKRSNGILLDTKITKAEKIPFNDNVYCVTVENGTWLMKYNEKISWTHNSDHPESSIISNDRISHNILKTWWEGKTLLGEMEILMSPGFINQGIISCQGDQIANLLRKGIMVGVSSRGVGSLQEIDGHAMVQDDFE